MMRIVSAIVLSVMMVLPMHVYAEGQGNSGWQQFKQDVKKTGHEIGKAGKEVGLGIADGAKKGGKAVKKLFTGKGSGNKGNDK